MGVLNKNTITLIGFMGVGKTTIGKALAKRLNYQFIDTDKKIEKQFNMKVTDIFKRHGEAAFRKAERDIIFKSLKKERVVISLGGGSLLQKEIKDACINHSIVIFLYLPWSAWRKRVRFLKRKRPLLQNKNMREIHTLFNERQKYYHHYHLKVNCTNLSANVIADKMIYSLKKARG